MGGQVIIARQAKLVVPSYTMELLIFISLSVRQCTMQLQIMQGRNEELMLPNKEGAPHFLSICDLQDKLSAGKGW